MTFNWNALVKKVRIYSIDNKMKSIYGMNISWPTVEQFPSCQPLDLFEYFEIDANTPLQIFFDLDIFSGQYASYTSFRGSK